MPLGVAVYVYSHVVHVLGIVVAKQLIALSKVDKTTCKVLVILLLRLSPLHLAQCRQTWQSHILHMFECSHILCPDIGLYTDDVASLICRQFLRHRLVRVDTLKRQISTDSLRLIGLVERLIIVEVEICVRSHYHVVVLLGSSNTATLATPRHNGCAIGESAFKNLVPTNDVTAKRLKQLCGMCYNVALQSLLGCMAVLSLKVQRLDTCLTLRTLLPLNLRTLVAANMDVF